MGYSHNFKLNGELTDNVLKDVKNVLSKYSYLTYEFNDDSPYVVSSELIRFNGYGEAGYETFYIEPHNKIFCKTGHADYDLAVCEVLLVLKHHYREDFELSSDGFWVNKVDFDKDLFNEEDNWNTALENVRVEFGYEFNIEKVVSSSGGHSYYNYKLN